MSSTREAPIKLFDKEATDRGVRFKSAAKLCVENASWSAPKSAKVILHPLSFSLSPGRILGVIGPNGAGKSTLLRLLYRYHAPTTGTVVVDGTDIWSVTARKTACNVAAVLQEHPTDFALTAREIVALGRTHHQLGSHLFALGSAGVRDDSVVQSALERLRLLNLADQQLGTLSGGERQCVMVARALAQEPRLLILDEPTNHLDIRHQLEVLELIRDLPLTIVTSLHDLNMAATVCDDVLMLKDGHSIRFGSPDTVLSEAAVSTVFHVTARLDRLVSNNAKQLTFNL